MVYDGITKAAADEVPRAMRMFRWRRPGPPTGED